MPQFEMPFDCPDDVADFAKLDAFTQGYIQGVFFTECHGDNAELEHTVFGDLAPATLKDILEDCAGFQTANAGVLEQVYSDNYDAERAGTDYWFTRNRHGAGFWDRGLGVNGVKLTKAAHADGSRDLYRGDDGKLYLS